MESAVDTSEARSEPVSEKRAPEELDFLKDASPPPKRSRVTHQCLIGDVRKVGEMVLVLAAMGKMRGGNDPSDVEKELMAEARARLAKVCEGFAPKDVFPGDAFGGVIEDLGLNNLKEQRLGFRPPKMSIAEKLLISKQKMEKTENFSLPSTPNSSRLHPKSGSAAESRNTAHSVRVPQPDKSGHMSISSGSFPSSSPLVRTMAVNSASLPYQLPTSEIRTVVSGALPSSLLNSAALPRVDRSHIRSDGRTNGSPHPPQIQANYNANSTVRTPTWSVQAQLTFSSKTALDNKVPVNMSLKVDGAAGGFSGLAHQTTARPVASQMLGPPSQGTSHVQSSPLAKAHAEICKIIQKLLQPRVSDRPTWIPPSRDYMNKALTCQICMSAVMEIDSILICDACEKGYHLKCLQISNQKGVPRGEWHCAKCLSLSNGKPLPPKYGRVMRNINTPKMLVNEAVVPSISSKSQGASDEKVSQLKETVNGNTTMENCSSGAVGNDNSHQTFGSERKESKAMQEKDTASFGSTMEAVVSSGISANSLVKNPSSANASSINSLNEKIDVKIADSKEKFSTEQSTVPSSSDKLQVIFNVVEESLLKQPLECHFVTRDSKEAQGQQSSRTLHQTVCTPSASGKHIPSKLQAMWEDKETTKKFVMVNQCYFPSDLPRPCNLESSEVYESTCSGSVMAGLIVGPWEVVPPRRFAEESERRICSGRQNQ